MPPNRSGGLVDPLAPTPPAEQGRGCVGCLVAPFVFFAWAVLITGVASLTPYPGMFGSVGALTGLVVAAYATYYPTAFRSRRARRWRLRRMAKRRSDAVIRATLTEATVEVDGAASSPSRDPADAPCHQGARAEVAAARNEDAMRLDGPPFALVVGSATLPVDTRSLKDRLDRVLRVAGWLDGQPDARVAWLTALILGEISDARLVGRALAELHRHAPDDALTARVTRAALGHSSARFRLAAACAITHWPTLEEMAFGGASMATFGPDDINDLIGALMRAVDARPAHRARVLGHPEAALRLALVATAAPDLTDDELVDLAADPVRSVRAMAFDAATKRAPEVALDAARQVARTRGDLTGGHAYIAHMLGSSKVAAYPPLPLGLYHLGKHGEARDVRWIALWLDDATHGHTARQARAQLHTRLSDHIELGQLSLAVGDDVGGGLSMHADGTEGALSTADAPGDPGDRS